MGVSGTSYWHEILASFSYHFFLGWDQRSSIFVGVFLRDMKFMVPVVHDVWGPVIWVFPNIGVVLPPQIIHFNRVFHYFHHPFWGTIIFGNIHIVTPVVCMKPVDLVLVLWAAVKKNLWF